MTRMRLCLMSIFLLITPIVFANDDLGKVYDYKIDEHGFFIQRDKDKKEIFYFPKTTFKFASLPSSINSEVETLQVNLYAGSPNENIHNEWSGYRYFPLSLTTQSSCQLPKDLANVRSIYSNGPDSGITVEGVSTQFICSMQLSVYKGHVEEVKENLSVLLNEGKILNNLFSVAFKYDVEVPITNLRILHTNLKSFLSPKSIIQEDAAIVFVGIGVNKDQKTKEAIVALSKEDRKKFIQMALNHLFNRLDQGLQLKDEIEDKEFSVLTEKTMTMEF